MLGARIRAAEVAKRQQAEASTRRNLLGSGDRSDRNRTYNFPQGRVTDHRINLTLYRLDEAMEGKLDMLIEPIVQNIRPISWRRCPSRNDDLSGTAAAGNRPRRRATVRDATPRSCWDTSPAGRARITAFGETTLSADEATTLEALLQRRQRGEPIAHLVGQRESWSLPLFVSPATLIPARIPNVW